MEFKDRLGYRWGERVWIRTKLDQKKISEKYKAKVGKLPELIIMPAFNPLSGGIPVNRNKQPEQEERHISPIIKSAKMKTAKIYMLDGTYLGELERL